MFGHWQEEVGEDLVCVKQEMMEAQESGRVRGYKFVVATEEEKLKGGQAEF